MTQQEALEYLDGHAIWEPEAAREACLSLGVKWDKRLEQVYEDDRHPLGVHMRAGPALGVYGLELAMHIRDSLGIACQEALGRGARARYIREAIAKKLDIPGDWTD